MEIAWPTAQEVRREMPGTLREAQYHQGLAKLCFESVVVIQDRKDDGPQRYAPERLVYRKLENPLG